MKQIFLILSLTLFLHAKEYPKSYSSCIGCHGLKGEKNAQAPESRPQKMSQRNIIRALRAYKLGKRNKYGKAKMMTSFAKHLSERDIYEIARYLKR